jgi:hypothetical protein
MGFCVGRIFVMWTVGGTTNTMSEHDRGYLVIVADRSVG